MPTTNPRVNLTLPPDLYESICLLAQLQDSKPATVIRDMLLDLKPMIDMSAEAIKMAKSDENKALKMLHNGLMQVFGDAAQRSIFDLEDSPNGND